MRREQKLMLVLAIIMAFIVTAVLLPGLISAGNLDPSGSPGPTMKTLDEIYDKLETIDGKLGGVEKTGQTTSYHTGDDGDLQKGVAWPVPRFTDNGDGTVTDNLTELIWLKNASRFDKKTWEEACDACNALADDGSELMDSSSAGNWRLPNVKELQSLIHFGYDYLALPDTAGIGKWVEGNPFSNVESSAYWMSTTYASIHAWGLIFTSGSAGFFDKTSVLYVWCVRDKLRCL